MKTAARALVQAVAVATSGASNETQLRHEVEKALERECAALCIPWTPFQLDRTLKVSGKSRFADVAHGAVIIEYEPPRSFLGSEGHKLRHARKQVEEYCELIHSEEGRRADEYVLVAWDGATIDFGSVSGAVYVWEQPIPFDDVAAERLLVHLREDGIPLVHPKLLADLVGPSSEHGTDLLPLMFEAVRLAASGQTSKTKLLFTEWKRLFGQVVGVQSTQLQKLLAEQSVAHGASYASDTPAYLFAQNTYLAFVAKAVAASALPGASQNVLDASVPVTARVARLESGELFASAGIVNMLSGDFFSWYADDPAWPSFAPVVERMLSRLNGISFDVARKSAGSIRDLFKGIYEAFVPRALRHALGEFYTPDWLAEHALDAVHWKVSKSMLDPTCGSGTFVLEALRRRLLHNNRRGSASEFLDGLFGIDLNPLAVLAAKASLAVYLAPHLSPGNPVRLPIYLADAINPARPEAGRIYVHTLQTELGEKRFTIPEILIRHPDFFRIFARIRDLIDNGRRTQSILSALRKEFPSAVLVSGSQKEALKSSIDALVDMHAEGWNGIWCAIIADRFAAGAIEPVEFVCGNPPWVKWSHLPPDYAAFIKPHCLQMGVFSEDRWVGGIESDISTVITYEAIKNYLAPRGRLAFFITGTVFTTESSAGFRNFSIADTGVTCRVEAVEDFSPIAPFDGVTNTPTLLLLRRDSKTRFPVPYKRWTAKDGKGRKVRQFSDAAAFKRAATVEALEARPVPGAHSRPWLVGTPTQHIVFDKVFGGTNCPYRARKGVTTDRNGIFWVKVGPGSSPGNARIINQPDIGRTPGIARVTEEVERAHLFPLLRGRGVTAFAASPDPEMCVVVPQREMHGDPGLDVTAPLTHKFLKSFRDDLESRSSYKRYQKPQGAPFYSLWSTGPYTFSRFKVVWREMPGGRFVAAYVGSKHHPVLGRKLVIPDHKVYFIPVHTKAEAAYLTGFLNSEVVAASISAYAAQLSLGVSVAEYVRIPQYDPTDSGHQKIARIAEAVTSRRCPELRANERKALDAAVASLLGI